MAQRIHTCREQDSILIVGMASKKAVCAAPVRDKEIWPVMGRTDESGWLMTASNANVIDLESRRRPKPPFAKLTKVFTEPDLPLKANERLVALVMFQHVNLTTMQCYPSIDTICRRARVGRHTVARTIKALQALGLLEVTKKRDKGKFDRNIYDFSNIRKHCDRVSR